MSPPTALSAICTPDGWKQRLGIYEYIYHSIATRTWRTNVWFGAEPLAEPAWPACVRSQDEGVSRTRPRPRERGAGGGRQGCADRCRWVAWWRGNGHPSGPAPRSCGGSRAGSGRSGLRPESNWAQDGVHKKHRQNCPLEARSGAQGTQGTSEVCRNRCRVFDKGARADLGP